MSAAAPAVAAVVGSAFARQAPEGLDLAPHDVKTPWGPWTLHRVRGGGGRSAFLSFRHGRPYRLLPHDIPYRAQAWALREAGCGALLVTSSVGVLGADLPLHRPLLVSDLLMPENRLPDGSPCTVFVDPNPDRGHLVFLEGPFSEALSRQVERLAEAAGAPSAGRVDFVYAPGPRGKTPAENRLWSRLGGQVNSMTLAPEVLLANELEMPCAGLVVGHKRSLPGRGAELDDADRVSQSLERSRGALEAVVRAFLTSAEPVPFANQIYRFEAGRSAP